MKTFIRYFGYILLISAVFRIIPIIAGLIYSEPISLFVLGAAISIGLGALFLRFEKRIKKENSAINLTQALVLVALSFIILPLIGSISFLPSFGYNILNAAFESISGFTTTGLTLYSSLEGLPKSLLLWRAETQWMGGIGIIIFFLFIISRLKFHGGESIKEITTSVQTTSALYQAQGFPEQLEPGLKKTSKNVILIYGGYTLLGVLLLYLTGMTFFDSVAMSFTSLSTGGFTAADNFYSNNTQLVVLSLLMILGSTSFIIHNKLLQKKFKEFLVSFEKNIFFMFLILGILLTFFVFDDVKVVLFELVSAFTTTGYSITDISLLPHLFIMILMIGMVIGGNIASTAGGIKVSRIYTLLKVIPWQLKKLSSPAHAIIPFKVNNKPVEEKDVLIAFVFVFSFLFILIIGTIIFMLLGYNFLDSSFQMTSALGTVGLQTMELIPIHWLGKLVLIIAMLLGRLEIFPLLILVREMFRRKS